MNRLTKTDFKKWKFVTMSVEDLVSVFNSLKTDLKLDANLGTSHVSVSYTHLTLPTSDLV